MDECIDRPIGAQRVSHKQNVFCNAKSLRQLCCSRQDVTKMRERVEQVQQTPREFDPNFL
jgi:hypothetical protein